MEVPLSGTHWESAYLPEHGSILLARGWERQLDTRYASLFYGPALTPAAYRAWLNENAVSYVALPDVRLDFAGAAEGRLIARGLPYLREVWRSAHWRLFAVAGAPALAQPPALLRSRRARLLHARGPSSGQLRGARALHPLLGARARARMRAQRSERVDDVQARAAGTIRVGIDFSLTRIFSKSPRCA